MFTLTSALDFVQQLEDEKIEIDACRINTESYSLKLQNVRKIEKDTSASPTVIHFAELVSRLVKNRLKIPVSLKVFMDSDAVNVSGLKYEAKMYEYITDNIIKPKYSPNFIPFVAFGCCEPDRKELQQKLDELIRKMKTTVDYILNLELDLATKNKIIRFSNWLQTADQFDPSQKYIVSAKLSAMKSINLVELLPVVNSLKQYEELFSIRKKCFLITEQAGNGSQFGLNGMYPVKSLNDIYSMLSNRDKYAVLFQIVYSLAVMAQFAINHNDLHAWNILVVDYKQNLTLKFIVGNKTFVIATRYIPYIFDWDNGYTPDLGDNPYVKAKVNKTTMSNIFDSRRDLYILLCYLGAIQENEQQIRPVEQYIKDPVKKYIQDEIAIPITLEQYETIKKEVYSQVNSVNYKTEEINIIYKLSRAELENIIGPNKLPTELINAVYFFVRIEDDVPFLYLWESFYCRPSGMSSAFITPLDMIRGNYFDRFLEKEKHRLSSSIQTKEFVYTFPQIN